MFRLRVITLTVYLIHLLLAQAAELPKIGFEIESSHIGFYNKDCTERANGLMKGHRVKAQSGVGWFLGVDTTPALKSELQAEYDVLCKLDDRSSLERIMGNVELSMDSLDELTTVEIVNDKGESDPYNPWRIIDSDGFTKKTPKALWDLQVTAPLPLEAIQDLLIALFKREDHPLLIKDKNWMRNVVYVQKNWLDSKFFQEMTGGSAWATKDVMGFLSLLLTHIKSAQELTASRHSPTLRHAMRTQGPKILVWIMPRMYWTTVFHSIKHRMPQGVELWTILEHLACYRNSRDGGLWLDSDFCQGNVDDPKPNGKLKKKAWSLQRGRKPLRVQKWVTSIVTRPATHPDALSEWDEKHFDGQIGGFDKLGKKFETVLGSNREVPIWEFRGLGVSWRKNLLERMLAMQSAVIELHKKYPEEPTS
ncbi:hypothetical protein LZ32DRAFT_645301 [Colletotrichum eremochloae]|nr:hypothetical protein LZ32DRAFT_645301 [Colletotrichum eremochloae]